MVLHGTISEIVAASINPSFKMPLPTNRCQFCGNTGGLTKSHIWPDWLNRFLPRTATHHEQEVGKFYTFKPRMQTPAYSLRIRAGHARSRRPRNTCAPCNSGWMSGIESMALPCGSRLIRGLPVIMRPFDQRVVAALFALIATRLEFAGLYCAVSPQDRDWLRMHREPTTDWRIWIATYAGDRPHDHWSKNYSAQLVSEPTDKVDPEHCNVMVATFVMGKLCAHMFYSPVKDFQGYEGVTLAQIWPPRRFDLDTRFLPELSDEEVISLHEAFARYGDPLNPARA
jgi:hypothetical protein